MNTTHNKPVSVNGFTVQNIAGGHFRAVNPDRIILFYAEGRNGALYFNVESYTDRHTNRCYTAQRYLYKLIPTARELSLFLADNDYLWDYAERKPFSETRLASMLRYDRARARMGYPLLYPEHTTEILRKEGVLA